MEVRLLDPAVLERHLAVQGAALALGVGVVHVRIEHLDLVAAIPQHAAGGKPFGLEAIDIARIEAGLLVMAVDYESGETSPFDVSLDKFIKPGTECVGAAALAAVASDPPKRLTTLQIESDAAAEAGAEVTRDGEVVGSVTSPTVSPRLGTIALAILDTDAAIDGGKVEVGGAVATVAPLSLYDLEKMKPRG